MRNYFLIFLLAITVVSCAGKDSSEAGDQRGSDTTNAINNSSTTQEKIAGCYIRVMGRDTLVANLHQNDKGKIEGQLTYNNFEKDDSHGPVSGTVDGDLIKLIYTFKAEGTTSVTEVLFKQAGNDLVPGYGEMVNSGDTARYASVTSTNFKESDKLSPIHCDSLPGKYK